MRTIHIHDITLILQLNHSADDVENIEYTKNPEVISHSQEGNIHDFFLIEVQKSAMADNGKRQPNFQ